MTRTEDPRVTMERLMSADRRLVHEINVGTLTDEEARTLMEDARHRWPRRRTKKALESLQDDVWAPSLTVDAPDPL